MDKIYCGSGKSKKFKTGGEIIRCVIDIETLQEHFKEHGFVTNNGKKKITLNVCTRKNIDAYGNSHSVSIDTWTPDPDYKDSQETGNTANFEDDIPF